MLAKDSHEYVLVLILKQIWSPKTDDLADLRQELSEYKSTITHAFLVEIREALVNIKVDADSERARELLNKLLPPAKSSFEEKATCLSGTRETVLKIVRDWLYDACKPSRLFWLYGVAGCGKSTIAASICKSLQDKRHLIGSFFCWRDQADRRDPVKLVWSIAFFLAKANPAFRNALLVELQDFELFSTLGPESQFERLIECPANNKDVKATAHSGTAVLVLTVLTN